MRFLLVAFLVCARAASARAAIVYLKDGGRIQGTVVSATAREVQVYTSNGPVRVDAGRISRIDYESNEAPPAASMQAPAPPPRIVASPPFPRRRSPEEFALEENRQIFSLDLGLAAPLSDVNFSPIGGGSGNNGDPGILLGAQYVYFLTPRLGAGVNFDYFHRSATDSQSLLSSADSNVFGDTLLILGVLRYSLVDHGPTRPYLLAGAGAHRTSTIIDATPGPGFSWSDTQTAETRRLVDDHTWGFASSVRFGIDFHFVDPSLFSFEIGWMGLANSTYQATPAGRLLGLSGVSGPLNVLTVAGRWGWRF